MKDWGNCDAVQRNPDKLVEPGYFVEPGFLCPHSLRTLKMEPHLNSSWNGCPASKDRRLKQFWILK